MPDQQPRRRQTATDVDPLALPWRVGSSFARNIYAQIGEPASKSDVYLGVVETAELAQYMVDLHNQELDRANGQVSG